MCFVDAHRPELMTDGVAPTGLTVHGDAFELLAHFLRELPAARGQVVHDGDRRRLAFPTRLTATAALSNLNRIATDVIREALWPGKYRRTAVVFA